MAETAVKKGRKECVGSRKTPWQPGLDKKDLPVEWSPVVCMLKCTQGCREVRGCLFFRSRVAVVCLLTEGRDAVREPVYVDTNETLAGWQDRQ